MAVCVFSRMQAAMFFFILTVKNKRYVSTAKKNTTLSGGFLWPGL